MTIPLGARTALIDLKPSDYGNLDLGSLVELHNTFSENDWDADAQLSRLLLNHPILKSALEGAGNGIVVELGPHRAITLDHLALAVQDIDEGRSPIILGIDKSPNWHITAEDAYPVSFCPTSGQSVLGAINPPGKPFLRQEFFPDYSKGTDTIFYKHINPRAFAVYGTTVEQAVLPGQNIDLFFLKSMLGYLGKTPDEAMKYLREHVLPRAKGIFVFDYLGECNHSKVAIPTPQALAAEITRAFGPRATIRQEIGQNYFMMYARR